MDVYVCVSASHNFIDIFHLTVLILMEILAEHGESNRMAWLSFCNYGNWMYANIARSCNTDVNADAQTELNLEQRNWFKLN